MTCRGVRPGQEVTADVVETARDLEPAVEPGDAPGDAAPRRQLSGEELLLAGSKERVTEMEPLRVRVLCRPSKRHRRTENSTQLSGRSSSRVRGPTPALTEVPWAQCHPAAPRAPEKTCGNAKGSVAPRHSSPLLVRRQPSASSRHPCPGKTTTPPGAGDGQHFVAVEDSELRGGHGAAAHTSDRGDDNS